MVSLSTLLQSIGEIMSELIIMEKHSCQEIEFRTLHINLVLPRQNNVLIKAIYVIELLGHILDVLN